MNSEMFPLLSIAYLWVDQLSENKSREQTDIAKNAVRQYIYHMINYNDAAKICQDSIGSTAPVNKLQAILNIIKSQEYPKKEEEQQITNRNTRNWSLPEDFRLLAAIHIFGLGKWKRIAEFVGFGRTRSQCSQRWTRALNPRLMKTVWSTEEEEKLLTLVRKYGSHSWSTISKEMVGRSDVQCRYKYMQMKKKKKTFVCCSHDVKQEEKNETPEAFIQDPIKMLNSHPSFHTFPNQQIPVLQQHFPENIGLKPLLPSLTNTILSNPYFLPNGGINLPILVPIRHPTFYNAGPDSKIHIQQLNNQRTN
ncbi:Myb-like DNA-binding domain containing protein [Histomonas meleagridis]|uniref:Myb-like DNA-binding domain containing protein n=1 Tax=Histomonas meleagridis TaxID=135588 RepID=UPI00355A29EA|nr:Myb-like DNA-binding domain containing protein [Histomonas meleagridis]KAH0797810.1 Myb-like DNA-binding domain containing protein [Histomonas meleagridis]